MKIAKIFVTAAVLTAGIFGGFAATSQVSYGATKSKIENAQNQHQQTIKKTIKLAKKGKIINSEKFGVHSIGSDIQKEWGNPDPNSDANYFSYNKRQIEFMLENDKVIWITSYDKKYENITLPEVKKIAGEPQKIKKGSDGYYLEYTTGNYILEFVFYYDAQGENPDTLKEIYVHLPS